MPRGKPPPRLSRIDEKVAKASAKARHVAMKQRIEKHKGRGRKNSLLRASKEVRVVQPTSFDEYHTSMRVIGVPADDVASSPTLNIKHSLPPYNGDKFSSNGSERSGGLLYLSRMSPGGFNRVNPTMSPTTRGRPLNAPPTSAAGTVIMESSSPVISPQSKAEAKADATRGNFAMSLCSLSWDPDARTRVVGKGAISAIAGLVGVLGKRKVLNQVLLCCGEDCACALSNFCENDALHNAVVRDGGVQAAVGLAQRGVASTKLKEDCIAALCKLSVPYGREVALVEGGVLPVIRALLLNSGTASHTARLCNITLSNIVCAKRAPFEKHDDLMLTLTTIKEYLKRHRADDGAAEMRIVLLKTLCNIAQRNDYRTRIIDEGFVRIFHEQQLGGVGTELPLQRFLIATVILILSRAKGTREKLTRDNIIGLLAELAEHSSEIAGFSGSPLPTEDRCLDAITRRIVLLTMCRLVAVESSLDAVLNDGGVDILQRLSSLPDDSATLQFATAIWAISCFQHGRLTLLGPNQTHIEHNLNTKKSFARRASTPTATSNGDIIETVVGLSRCIDARVQGRCALALSNFLLESAFHGVLLRKGTMLALTRICIGGDELARLYAVQAVYNLSRGAESRQRLAETGVAKVMIETINDSRHVETCRLCAAALGNLTLCPVCLPDGRDDATAGIPALLRVAGGGGFKHAGLALFNLAVTDENCEALLSDAMQRVLCELAAKDNTTGVWKYDTQTHAVLGALVSRLSTSPCRSRLLGPGLVEAMVTLGTGSHDERVIHNCLCVLVNLAHDSTAQPQLAQRGVVPALVKLSASHDRQIRAGCASTLCNLACDTQFGIPALVESSAVRALVVLGCVNSSTVRTSHYCLASLYNVLQTSDDELLKQALKHGALFGAATLPRNGNAETAYLASVCFCNVSARAGTNEFVANPHALKSLISIASGAPEPTMLNCVKSLHNIALIRENIAPLARIGAAEFLRDVALRATSPNSAYLAVLALCYLTGDSGVGELLDDLNALQAILSPPIQQTDVVDVMADPHDFVEARINAIYNLSRKDSTCRALMRECGAVRALQDIMTDTEDPSVHEIVYQTIYHMTLVPENRSAMMSGGVMVLISRALNLGLAERAPPTAHVMQIMAHALYNLSTEPSNHASMVNEGAASLCCDCWSRCDNKYNLNGAEEIKAVSGEDIREVAASTLVNLACGHINSARMLAEGSGEVICSYITNPQAWLLAMDANKRPGLEGQQRILSASKEALARLPVDLCAAALRNLLCLVPMQQTMIEQHGALQALIQLHATKRIESAKRNSADAILILCRNTKVRKLVQSYPAAQKVIDAALVQPGDTADGMPGAELNPDLLAEIQQETFKLGKSEHVALGRAEIQNMPAIRTSLRVDDSNAPAFHVTAATTPWSSLNADFLMTTQASGCPQPSMAVSAEGASNEQNAMSCGAAEPEEDSDLQNVDGDKIPIPDDVIVQSVMERNHASAKSTSVIFHGTARRNADVQQDLNPMRQLPGIPKGRKADRVSFSESC